jgi:hypothetical protein
MPNIWASLNVPFIHFLLQFFPNSKDQERPQKIPLVNALALATVP